MIRRFSIAGGLAAIPISYAVPFFNNRGKQADLLTRTYELDARTYLLTYDKKSPLTGSFKREPEGFGIGYDFALRCSHPQYGSIAGGELTSQQSEIDGIFLGEEGGLFSTRPRDSHLDRGLGLATGVGYEMVAEANLDFGFLGGVRVNAQRGVYPSLSFPKVDGADRRCSC